MTPLWYHREIARGDFGPDVDVVRRKLGLGPGIYDEIVEERIRGLARAKKIEVTDEVTPELADALGESAAVDAGLTPVWFSRVLSRGDVGDDVRSLRRALGVWDDNRFEVDCEAAVRRLQSANRLDTDGVVTAEVAILAGE